MQLVMMAEGYEWMIEAVVVTVLRYLYLVGV